MAKETEALFDVEPLPPFFALWDAIRAALPSLKPLARLTVSETATRRMIEAGGHWVPYRHDVAPYMVEPMDVTTSRRFDSIAFVGPARSSKSEGLVINPIVHAILAQPRKVAMFSATKGAAQEWSEGLLDHLIRNSPELSRALSTGKGSDNIFTKKFKGGMRLTVDWPVGDKLMQRSLDLVIGTDYDKFKADIGGNSEGMGEGGAFPLMRKRTESAGSRGMTIVESSPRYPILDETWTPDTPHEAPPCEGIVAIYNGGSRGRLYWTCPECSHEFIPTFERLEWPKEGSPSERGAGAYMLCPSGNGCVIEPRQKADLNLAARWLHEDEDGGHVPLDQLKRNVSTASFWLPGPAAALAPWSRLVSRYIEATHEFAKTGGEGTLKSVTNVELGLPYLPRARSTSEALSLEILKSGATDHAWQTAPPDTAFLIAAIDVQKGKFVCQVEAYLPHLERVLIDRFEIVNPPDTSPNAEGRAISPEKYGEDWDAILPMMGKVYPVEGATHGLKILGIVCDLRGQPGVTPRARDFYRKCRVQHRNRFYLVQGEGGDTKPRAVYRHPEKSHTGNDAKIRDVPNIFAGSDRLKDEVAASLMREASGERKLNLPRYAPHEVFEEYCAERRTDKGWKKRPGVERNEALDLSVYSLALVITLEAEAINWANPPKWAQSNSGNLMAVQYTDGNGDLKTGQLAPPEKPTAKKWAVKKPKRKW